MCNPWLSLLIPNHMIDPLIAAAVIIKKKKKKIPSNITL